MIINDKYKLISDDMNIVLQEKFQKKDDKGEGYKSIGFYPDLKSALKGMCKREIKGTGFEDLEVIDKKINELYDLIDKKIDNLINQ